MKGLIKKLRGIDMYSISPEDWLAIQEAINKLEKLEKNKKEELYTWDQVEAFGRAAFYKGREVDKLHPEYNYPIFTRPTYNGYLREIEGKVYINNNGILLIKKHATEKTKNEA